MYAEVPSLRGVPSYYLATFQGRILWADFWVRKEVKKIDPFFRCCGCSNNEFRHHSSVSTLMEFELAQLEFYDPLFYSQVVF